MDYDLNITEGFSVAADIVNRAAFRAANRVARELKNGNIENINGMFLEHARRQIEKARDETDFRNMALHVLEKLSEKEVTDYLRSQGLIPPEI